jgi:hypothetical protein
MSQQLVEKLQQLLISDSTLISEVLLEPVFNSVSPTVIDSNSSIKTVEQSLSYRALQRRIHLSRSTAWVDQRNTRDPLDWSSTGSGIVNHPTGFHCTLARALARRYLLGFLLGSCYDKDSTLPRW